jgi:predicted flavoprotein YhiN
MRAASARPDHRLQIEADAIILGAGPAGLLCGTQINERGQSVLVLEAGADEWARVAVEGVGGAGRTRTASSLSTPPADSYGH